MTKAFDHLLKILDLRLVGPGSYVGQSEDLGFRQLFGGQLLGQAVLAAGLELDQTKELHSLQAHFLQAGDPHLPVSYRTEVMRDSKAFALRRIDAHQEGRHLLTMLASFHRAEPGFAHQAATMPVVPGPDQLVSDQLLYAQHSEALPASKRQQLLNARGIEMRTVDPLLPGVKAVRPPTKQVWLRAAGSPPASPALHQALLAYSSDFGLAMTALLPHAAAVMDLSLQLASLDHSLWLHRPCRFDQWHLHVMESPIARGARGLVRGQIFSQDGLLVASVMQEGLMRSRSLDELNQRGQIGR